MKHDLKIPALVCVTFTKVGDASHCSFIHCVPLLLERFSIVSQNQNQSNHSAQT